MPKPTPLPTDPAALVRAVADGDYFLSRAASAELKRLLATDADMTEAAAVAVDHLVDESGPALGTLLAVVNRHPPADWLSRVDALFVQVKKAKKAGDRQRAAYLLARIGGSNRWDAPLHDLHPPDLWPRLWAFAESSDKKVAAEVKEGVQFGPRSCPDRAAAERFVIENKLPDLAVHWAWMGEDVRPLMDRLFDARLVSRKIASDFTIVYALQNNDPAAALELYARIEDQEKVYTVQDLAVYGKLIQPVAAVVEWVGGLLGLDHAVTRAKAAQGACERAERKQDIGSILPHLGRALDAAKKLTGDEGPSLWWSASALGVTPTHLPQHRAAALAELQARLTGKAVARRGAGYGLTIAHLMDRDLDAVGKLLGHEDDKVCAGALNGFNGAPQHMNLPGNMHDFREIVKPLKPAIRKLAKDARKDVAAAAASAARNL